MKFKIPAGTETFRKLKELDLLLIAAYNAANKLARDLGAEEWYGAPGWLEGGLSALKFKEKPEGWKKADTNERDLYFPMVKNKEALAKIHALPKVHYCELNNLVGYSPRTYRKGNSMYRSSAPYMEYLPEVVLMSTPEGVEYTPPNTDIIEILESEYVRLSKEGEKELEPR